MDVTVPSHGYEKVIEKLVAMMRLEEWLFSMPHSGRGGERSFWKPCEGVGSDEEGLESFSKCMVRRRGDEKNFLDHMSLLKSFHLFSNSHGHQELLSAPPVLSRWPLKTFFIISFPEPRSLY